MTLARRLPQQRWADIGLAGIIVLAAFLRLFALRYGQYGSDDERLWSAALREIANRALPVEGIKSSIGLGNGPFQVFLVTPAALFTQTPLAGTIIVALLNVAGVYFLYRFVAEFCGERPALFAGLLFAVNSWAVIYSRRMQAQDMLAPLEILFFWNATRWLVRGRAHDLVLAFLWLAMLSQVYILGLIYFALMPLFLLLGWKSIRPIPTVAGAAVLALLSYRYFGATILPHRDVFRGVGSGSVAIDGSSLENALIMASHKGYQTIAGQAGSVLDATSGVEGLLVAVEEALFAAGVFFLGWRFLAAGRKTGWRSAAFPGVTLIWFIYPVALFIRHSMPLYPYYYVTVLPVASIATGLLLDHLSPRIGLPSLAVLSANSLLLAGVFFSVIPGYFTHNDYGLPYQRTFDAADKIQHLALERHVHRVYIDGDMDPSEVMSSVLKRRGLDVFWFDDYRTPEFAAPPASDPPAVYVSMADDTRTAHFLHDTFNSEQALLIPLEGEGNFIRAYVLEPSQVRDALDRLLAANIDLAAANGMRLESFQAVRRLSPGTTLTTAVSWSWTGNPRPGQLFYSLFAHLVDASGKSVAQEDRPLLPSADWLAGERVVQWLGLQIPANLPPGRYWLSTGVYAADGVVRQQLIDGEGKSVGSSVNLGPFVVPPPPSNPVGKPAGISFGDGIRLDSYSSSRDGDTLTLDLRWVAEAPPSRDYTVYVHLLDGQGKMIAQTDGQPRNGEFPTSFWLAGDRVQDVHGLAVPPGRYTVEVGLYYLPTLERLPGGPLRFEIQQ